MKWILLLSLATACTPKQPTAPIEKTTPTTKSYFNVTLPEGDDGRFEVARQGQDGYEKDPTRVTIGETTTIVGLGERKTFPFATNPNGLTRIAFGNVNLLVNAKPNKAITLGDDPCNGWSLYDDVYDHTFAEPPLAACAEEGEECPEGMVEAGFPSLAADPLCKDPESQTGRRCVFPSTFEWTGESPLRWAFDDRPIEEPIRLTARFRCFEEVRTDTDAVQLVIGLGESWTLREEGGKITGSSASLKIPSN